MIRQVSRRRFLKQSALAVACATAAVAAESSSWKAGVAKAVITPEKPVWLAGYGSKRPPDGKLHDLWMKALALEDAGRSPRRARHQRFPGRPQGDERPRLRAG